MAQLAVGRHPAGAFRLAASPCGAPVARKAGIHHEALREFELVALADPEPAIIAAANFRLLRGRGVTVRTTVDLVIGTLCVKRGHALLHKHCDFAPMERLLGLQAA